MDGVAASSSSGRASIVRYEVDFADATPGSLQPDGAYVLVDRQWTSVNSVTGATSLAIGANGLEFAANTATTQTSTAGITAAGILIDLGVLVGSAYDPTLRYRVEARLSPHRAMPMHRCRSGSTSRPATRRARSPRPCERFACKRSRGEARPTSSSSSSAELGGMLLLQGLMI